MDQKNMDSGHGQMNNCEMCDHKHEGSCDNCGACRHGKCCGYGMHGHRSCWRWVFKFIVLIVILTVVFSVGMLAGAAKVLRSGYGGAVLGPNGMIGARGMMNSGWSWMMGGQKAGTAQAFGVVSLVNGTRINYTDNGGKTGAIISSSATTIVSGNNPIGLSAIKSGQTISAYGTLDQSGELQASWIAVQ